MEKEHKSNKRDLKVAAYIRVGTSEQACEVYDKPKNSIQIIHRMPSKDEMEQILNQVKNEYMERMLQQIMHPRYTLRSHATDALSRFQLDSQ